MYIKLILQIVDFDDSHPGVIKFLSERTPLAEYIGYGGYNVMIFSRGMH